MAAQLQATDVALRVLTVRKTLALVSPQLGSPLSKRKSDRQEVRLLRTCFPYSLCMVVNFSQHSDCKDAVLVKCHKVKAKWVRLHSKKGKDYHDWIVHNLRKEWQGCTQEPVDKQEEHAGNAKLIWGFKAWNSGDQLNWWLPNIRCLQGLSERMSKVKCLWKSQFSQKISFLNCFRSEISGKFIPYSIQVHQNHPKASLEAGASDVLSGCERLFEADQWLWDSDKRPKIGVSVCKGQN